MAALLAPALLLLSTGAWGRTWNVPADGALGTIVYSIADGDVIELDPGCCSGGYFPIPEINRRVTIRSSSADERAAAPAMRINAAASSGAGVVLERLTFVSNSNACTGSIYCTLEVAAGVQLELFDVAVTTGSDKGIYAKGTASSPVTIRLDGFEANGSQALVEGTYVDLELRNGTIDGIRAAAITGGSILAEALVHVGGTRAARGGLLEAIDVDEVRVVGLDSEGAYAGVDGGLIFATRTPVTLEDAVVRSCGADAAGGLLALDGDGQAAALTRVRVEGCTAVTGAALVQAFGYDVTIDRFDVRGVSGAGDAALFDVRDGDLRWMRGEVCDAAGVGSSGVRVERGVLSVNNVAFRGVTGLGAIFEQVDPTGDGLLAQLTLDLEGAAASAVVSGGAVELFDNQLHLDGAGLGEAVPTGRSGYNHVIGTFPDDWPVADGDFADADPGWVEGYLDQRGDCTSIGVPRVREDHPAWDGGYTTADWRDPDCSPSDIGVFGGPHVDLERATWFGDEACADGAGEGVRFGGGFASCGCGGGATGAWLLLVPWLRRRRR